MELIRIQATAPTRQETPVVATLACLGCIRDAMAKVVVGTHAANITLNIKNAAAKDDRLRALVRFAMTRYGDYNVVIY